MLVPAEPAGLSQMGEGGTTNTKDTNLSFLSLCLSQEEEEILLTQACLPAGNSGEREYDNNNTNTNLPACLELGGVWHDVRSVRGGLADISDTSLPVCLLRAWGDDGRVGV